jgi:hypothetical protein
LVLFEVVFLEPEKFVHSIEMHQHLLDKAVIDWIVVREMMAAVFCGKRVKINGLQVVNLNRGNIIHKSKIPACESLIDVQINYVFCYGKWGKNIRAVKIIQRTDLNQDIIHINISWIRFSKQFSQTAFL